MAMNMDNAPRLGPTGERPNATIPRVKNTPMKKRQTKTPSQLLKERQDADEQNKTLAQRLLEANEAMPPGEGTVGKALKAGVSGAAVGATLGEALAKMHQEKIQQGIQKKPQQVSGQALTDTDLRDELFMAGKGRNPGPQQKRYTRRLRERMGKDYIQPTDI